MLTTHNQRWFLVTNLSTQKVPTWYNSRDLSPAGDQQMTEKYPTVCEQIYVCGTSTHIINASELKHNTLHQQLHQLKQNLIKKKPLIHFSNLTAHCTNISHTNTNFNYYKCMFDIMANNELNSPRNCTLPRMCMNNVLGATTHTPLRSYQHRNKHITDGLNFTLILCHIY